MLVRTFKKDGYRRYEEKTENKVVKEKDRGSD
jgi:hypothetical protein